MREVLEWDHVHSRWDLGAGEGSQEDFIGGFSISEKGYGGSTSLRSPQSSVFPLPLLGINFF